MEHTVEIQKRHRAHPDGEFTIKPRDLRNMLVMKINSKLMNPFRSVCFT